MIQKLQNAYIPTLRETTITFNVGILAQEGMRQTDPTILDIMTHRYV